jgi:hypothetical protein
VDDDELFRINSLHRFRKHSKLLLEAHSHCEVPAGCGGAVLQWSNPTNGVPVHVDVQSSSWADATFIDGQPVSSAGLHLRPGPHVLAFTLVPSKLNDLKVIAEAWFIVHLRHRPLGTEDRFVADGSSTPNTAWRLTTTEPPAGWSLDAFDDTAWLLAVPTSRPPKLQERWKIQQVEALRAAGCLSFAMPAAPTVWVRRRFVLPGATP